jgi:hypothetical protein
MAPRSETRQSSPEASARGRPRAILAAMGYNPYRRFRARPLDYALVAAAILAAVALVTWAIVG